MFQSRPAISARRSARSRRGSVLLMVVAVLALLAIIAVAYTTLGRADRAASAALVRESRLDDRASQIADYLSSVIGGDVLSTYAERRGDGNWAVRREATDAPGGSEELVSDINLLPAGWTRFTPGGSYSGAWTGGGIDRRRPSDPWLASSEQEYIPEFGQLPPTAFDMSIFDEPPSWRAISNFAPDGRFVNLVHLRGNFGARPGFGNDAGVERMSNHLRVLDSNGLPGTQNVITDLPLAADNSVPADFGSNQYRAARLMFDDLAPSDRDHINNQWADADGDGFADSRWIELVDAFDPDLIQHILPQDGRARYFVAARAIDLCSMVNLNSACDFLYEPEFRTVSGQNMHYPAGLTPADVDLRRLLRLGDLNWVFRNGATSFGYDVAFNQGAGVSNYSTYDRNLAIDIGKSSYAALRHAINSGQVLGSSARNPGEPLLAWNTAEATPNAANPNPLSDSQRARYYDEFAADPFAASSRAANSSFQVRAAFGLADELELRTFNGVNDSDHLSKAERALGGREAAASGFSPLRDNRPRAAEMQGRPGSTGTATPEALLGVFADIRHLLTTHSASRPIIENPLITVSSTALDPFEYKIDALSLMSRVDRRSGNAPTVADLQGLFEYYVSALMPYTNLTQYPDAWDRNVNTSRGLSYGESAELAQRICAHLVANTVDAMDEDLNGGAGSDLNVPTRIALEAVANAPNDTLRIEQTNVLALRDNVRPNVSAGLHAGSPRTNIYGIEAQPFLIEVGWFGMFTDTPVGAVNGSTITPDDEWAEHVDDGMVPPTILEYAKVTINDDPNMNTNSDFMFEVLAFQLTNPFDKPLKISAGGAVSYYIEYSNRFFALVQRDPDGDSILANDVDIPAYGTKVFYAINVKDPKDIGDRLIASRYIPPGGTPGALLQDYVDRWAERQFGTACVPIPMVHRKSFAICDGGGFGSGALEVVDLFAETTIPASAGGDAAQGTIDTLPASREMRKVANLWRVFRPTSTPTDFEGDILIDRVRDPATTMNGTIGDFRSGSGNTDVPNTEAGDDTDSNDANDEDNTGFAVTKWAGFRRPTNQAGINFQRGSMPPWCIEAKAINEYDPGNASPLNRAYDEPPFGLGDGADYRSDAESDRRDSLQELLDAQLTMVTVNTQIHGRAEVKTGNAIPANKSMPAKEFQEVAVQVHLSGGSSNPQLFARAGDFLLPLAIGPAYDPLAPIPAGLDPAKRVDQLEAQWLTLAEALALSCDYYSPTFAVDPLLYHLGHRDDAMGIRPRLDRGNLVLNDFAPYLDNNNNGTFEPDTDESIGRGVPMAYNVVDLFNTTDRWKSNPAGTALVPRTRAHGGTRSAIFGQINLNTAPLSVLRMIPMFSPSPDGDPENWVTRGTPPDQIYNFGADHFDIAAMVAAYRDKTVLTPRPLSATGALPFLNFRDDNDGDPMTYDGRFRGTRIAAIREQPGFKSVGEMLALRYNDPTASATARLFDNSIDRFADDLVTTPTAQPKRALESTLLRDGSGISYNPDEIPNDYDEQLAIANAAFNSTTVRSDTFCVWFIVHGYLPSDVENLGPNDPMIPSIARRYVMVVDRSNVVQAGQKPNILLFQEVPYR